MIVVFFFFLAGIGKNGKEHSHAVPSTESLCKLIGAEPSLRGAAILHDVGLLAVLEAVALQEILTRHAAGYLGDAIFADFVSTYTEDERKRSGRNERMSCCHHCTGISASLIGTSHFLVPMQICRRNQQSAVSLSFFVFFSRCANIQGLFNWPPTGLAQGSPTDDRSCHQVRPAHETSLVNT